MKHSLSFLGPELDGEEDGTKSAHGNPLNDAPPETLGLNAQRHKMEKGYQTKPLCAGQGKERRRYQAHYS